MRNISRRRRRAAVRVGIDALALSAGAGASILGEELSNVPAPTAPWIVLHVLLTMALLGLRGAYRFRLQTSPLEQVSNVLGPAALAATLTILLRVGLAPDPDIASETIRLWAFLTVYLVGARLAHGLVSQRADRQGISTLVVGAGVVGQRVASRLRDRPQYGLRPVGFLDKEPKDLPDGVDDLPVLGASWDLERVVAEHEIDHVLVTFSRAPHDVFLNLVRRCRALGVEVSLVPRLFEEVSNRMSVEHLGGVALLRIDQSDPRGWQFEVKYAIDRITAIVAVAILSPLLLLIAAVVKLDSPGPVLFRQRRVGRDGREFDILKFRTMREAPDNVQSNAAWAAAAVGSDEVLAETPEDDRRTRSGRLLRRSSLDELPQLFNVLRGEMSFVGPRPEQAAYVEAFDNHVYRYGDRHRVKSGLTGWAQVNGLRGDTSLEDRIEWDNYYVESWTPWLDLKIILLTPGAVLGGVGSE